MKRIGSMPLGWQESKRRLYLSSQQTSKPWLWPWRAGRGCIAIRLQLRLLRQRYRICASTPLTTVIPTPTSKMRLCTISMLRIIKTSNSTKNGWLLTNNASRQGSSSCGTSFSADWKERVVVERVTQQTPSRAVAPGSVNFGEGSSTHRNLRRDPDIHKEAFVREEVKVKKVVDQETVEAQETRREELDVDTEGSVVDGSNSGKTSQNQKRSKVKQAWRRRKICREESDTKCLGLTHVPRSV